MEYEKCLVQVYEILNQLSEEEILKIPEKVIKNIEHNRDENYIWKYDETKDLIHQELDRKAVAILSYINLNYLLNEEERELFEKMHEDNEELLFPKVGNVNFSKPIETKTTKEIENNNMQELLVKENQQKWYQKIWKIISLLFNK